jgi:hypothetical protein
LPPSSGREQRAVPARLKYTPDALGSARWAEQQGAPASMLGWLCLSCMAHKLGLLSLASLWRLCSTRLSATWRCVLWGEAPCASSSVNRKLPHVVHNHPAPVRGLILSVRCGRSSLSKMCGRGQGGVGGVGVLVAHSSELVLGGLGTMRLLLQVAAGRPRGAKRGPFLGGAY